MARIPRSNKPLPKEPSRHPVLNPESVSPESAAMAVAAEKLRIAAILRSDAAQAHMASAIDLALDTTLSADSAVAILARLPAATANSDRAHDAFMKAMSNEMVGIASAAAPTGEIASPAGSREARQAEIAQAGDAIGRVKGYKPPRARSNATA